jgi:hypothetical protein
LHFVQDRRSREIWSRIAARVFPFLNFDVRRTRRVKISYLSFIIWWA